MGEGLSRGRGRVLGDRGYTPTRISERDWTPVGERLGSMLDKCIKDMKQVRTLHMFTSWTDCFFRDEWTRKPQKVSVIFFSTTKLGPCPLKFFFLHHPTVMDPQAFQTCYVCKQSRPCCRQPLMHLRKHGHHEKFVYPVRGPLKDAWGLGSVWVTCCHAYYGMYYDDETTAYQPMFLGDCEEQALNRVKHVKSFLYDLKGR